MMKRSSRAVAILLGLSLPVFGGLLADVWAGTFEVSGQLQSDHSAVFVTSTVWQGFQSPGLSQANQGVIYFDTSTFHFEVSENGGAYFNLLSGNLLLSTTNTFTAPNTFTNFVTLTNSSITFTGANVGVYIGAISMTGTGFAGSGSNLTNLNASSLNSGTLGNAGVTLALSSFGSVTGSISGSNVSGGTFGTVNGSNLTNLTAGNISANGTFLAENGSALTALNAGALTSGTVGASLLPSTVAYTGNSNTFASSQTVTGTNVAGGYSLSLSSGLNMPAGTVNAANFIGNGAGLTGVTASAIAAGNISTGGTFLAENGSALTNLAAANLAANGTFPIENGSALTNLGAGNITANGTFLAENGSALTALNAGALTSGTVGSGVLPSTVDYTTVNATISGVKTYSSSATFTASGANQFSVQTSSGVDVSTGVLIVGNGANISTVTPNGFFGNGAGLSNVTASAIAAGNITSGGTFLAENGSALTNLVAGSIAANGTFLAENGSALTALNAGALTAGTVASGLLPSTVAYTSIANTFSSSQTFTAAGANQFSILASSGVDVSTGIVIVGNGVNISTITPYGFFGNGAGLTNLTASAIAAGNITAGGTFLAENGSALTNLNAGALTAGTVASGLLPSTVAYTSIANTFSSSQTFTASGANQFSLLASSGVDVSTGILIVGNGLNISTITPYGFFGNGAGLTNVAASAVSAGAVTGTGVIASTLLPSTVAYTSSTNSFTAEQEFGNGTAMSTFTATGNLQLTSGSTITANGTLTISTSPTAGAAAVPGIFLSSAGFVGIGTAAVNQRLAVNGNIALTAGTGSIVAGTQIALEQTGDTYGPTALLIQNRNGSNGALYQQLGTVDLVDFGLQPLSGPQSNIRLEHRAGTILNPANSTGELEWLDSSTSAASAYLLGVGRGAFIVLSSSAGFGTQYPQTNLDDNGSAQFGNGATKSTFTALGNLQMAGNAAVPTSPPNGALWYNTTQNNFEYETAVGSMGVAGLLAANTSVPAGNTFGTSTGGDFASNYTIPANSLAVGKVLHVHAAGVYGTKGAPTGNFTLQVLMGATVIGTTGANALTGGLTNQAWTCDFDIIIDAIGASGSVEGQGRAILNTAALTANTIGMANTATVTVNTTGALTLQLGVTWATNNAANTITLRQFIVQVLN